MNKKILGLALATLLSVSISFLAITKLEKNSSEAIIAPEVEVLACGEGSPFDRFGQYLGYCSNWNLSYVCKFGGSSCRIFDCLEF